MKKADNTLKREMGGPKQNYRGWVVMILLAVTALVFAHFRFIYAYGIRNGHFLVGRYRLVEERWDHPKLQLLRRREHLDQVVASGHTEFEKIVLLRHWTRSQWNMASSFYYPPWDALEILDLARRHKNYGFCAQYAMVFLQACRSLGLHTKYVNLGHFLTAVWSDDYDKWVIMDPTNDIHFEKAGVPMSGRELSEAAWSNRLQGIVKVGSDGSRTRANPDDIDPYRKYSILLSGYALDKPIPIVVNGKRRLLVHEDDFHKYPKLNRDGMDYTADILAWQSPGKPSQWPGGASSDDPDDFRDGFNETVVVLASEDVNRGRIRVRLVSENAPEFETFMAKPGDAHYMDTGNEIIWELKPGINVMSARLKTKNGWLGPESTVKIYYKPDWMAHLLHRSATLTKS